MLTADELYSLAKCRFEESKILRDNNRPDGAVYLCGYALELLLKRHIVLRLRWAGYPDKRNEFENLISYKTHNLDVLLKLSGLENEIRSDNSRFAYWQRASTWKSENRYQKIGTISTPDATNIIDATRFLLNYIHPLNP